MSCLLLLCLTGIYFEGGIGVLDHAPDPGKDFYWQYDSNKAANPRGRVAMGHEWGTEKFKVNLEVRHESWLATRGDFGQNSVWVSGRVYPWR